MLPILAGSSTSRPGCREPAGPLQGRTPECAARRFQRARRTAPRANTGVRSTKVFQRALRRPPAMAIALAPRGSRPRGRPRAARARAGRRHRAGRPAAGRACVRVERRTPQRQCGNRALCDRRRLLPVPRQARVRGRRRARWRRRRACRPARPRTTRSSAGSTSTGALAVDLQLDRDRAGETVRVVVESQGCAEGRRLLPGAAAGRRRARCPGPASGPGRRSRPRPGRSRGSTDTSHELLASRMSIASAYL